MKWAIRSGFLALSAVLLVGNVKADTVFDYTLSQGSTTIATFSLPKSPASDPSTASTYSGGTGFGLMVTPLNLVINGTSSPDMLDFFNSAVGGGIEDIPPDSTATPAFNLGGAQLYSGDESPLDLANPVQMLGGPFTLFACADAACDTLGDAPYTLSTVAVSGSVPTPEPSSLLLFGIGLTGLLLFRKRYPAH